MLVSAVTLVAARAQWLASGARLAARAQQLASVGHLVVAILGRRLRFVTAEQPSMAAPRSAADASGAIRRSEVQLVGVTENVVAPLGVVVVTRQLATDR